MSQTVGKTKRTTPRPGGDNDAEPASVPRGRDASIELGDLPKTTGYTLRRAQLAVFQDFMRYYAAYDIRPGQYSVLTVIELNPGLKQSQVSAALGIKRANLVALLDTLEQRGLAKRVPVASDRRSYALYLTEAGTELMRKLREINATHESRITARIGESGRAQLLQLLEEVIEATGNTDASEDEET